MDYQTFLQKVIAEMPSRVYDSSVYISEVNEKTGDVESYRIVEITNEGNNDSLHIYIEKY